MGGYTSYGGGSSSYDYSSKPAVTKRSASSYAKEDKRTYKKPEKGITMPVGKTIESNSPYSAVLVVDVTGSMQEWPKMIFDKIPALYSESNVVIQGLDLENLARGGTKPEDKLELSVIGIGDITGPEMYPIQVLDFAKGPGLVRGIKTINPEGQGGPFGRESYEMAAYYLNNFCKTPKVPKGTKPILVFACDEDFYPTINPADIKKCFGKNIGQYLDSDEVMKDLTKKFDTYVLRPEPQGECGVYLRAQAHWESILGKQKVLKMKDPARLVDDFIAICGYSADNFNHAKKLLDRRQDPKQVKDVLDDLHPLLSSPKKKTTARKKNTKKKTS